MSGSTKDYSLAGAEADAKKKGLVVVHPKDTTHCIRCHDPMDEEFVAIVARTQRDRGMEVKRPKVCADCVLAAIANMEDIDIDGEIKNRGST